MVQQTHPVAQPNAQPLSGAVRIVGNDVERYTGAAWAKVNAYQATQLAVSRTFTLTGDVTGSGSFNGTANMDIPTTIPWNSHNHERPLAVFGGNNFTVGNGGWSGLNVTWTGYDNSSIISGQSGILRVPGWWLCIVNVWFADNVTGQRMIEQWGADGNIPFTAAGASDGAGRWARTSACLVASDGSKGVQAVVWQNSGIALTVTEWTHSFMWVAP